MLPIVGIRTEWVGVGKTNLADAPRTSIDMRANICEGLCNALNDDNGRIREKMLDGECLQLQTVRQLLLRPLSAGGLSITAAASTPSCFIRKKGFGSRET